MTTQSSPFPNQSGPPDIESVARLINSGKAKSIVIMAGAGISTAAGIPDFRTPGTGLYANLSKYNLPTPEAVFSIDYFQENPSAFFTLSKELCPVCKIGWSHRDSSLADDALPLAPVDVPTTSLTVDTLERMAGLPAEKIVEAHGSFATSRCTKCSTAVNPDWMLERLRKGEIVRCEEAKCRKRTGGKGGLVKPDIVFFGEGLPSRFFELLTDFPRCDLLLVFGTSLQVQPFASLISRVPSSCPRVLVNLERVGELADFSSGGSMFRRMNEDGFDFEGAVCGGKEKTRDVFYEGKCDDAVHELVRACGWEDDFTKVLEDVHEQVKRSWAGTTENPDPASQTAARAAEDIGNNANAVMPASTECPQTKESVSPTEGSAADKLADDVSKLGLETTLSTSEDDPTSSGKL